MRVRMLLTAAGPQGVWPAGSVREVDDALGRQMVAAREAEALEPVAPAVTEEPDPAPQEADVVAEAPEMVTEPPAKVSRAKKARSRGR